jgi:hypothetical protein
MKKFLAGFLMVPASALWMLAAPADIFVNNSPLFQAPQVDARAFVNRSTIDIFTGLPFRGQNVMFWTNHGLMTGTPGYQFELNPDGRRRRGVRANSRSLQQPSSMFYNDGDISVGTTLFVNATNIFSPGGLEGSESANITLLATNGFADVSRSGIRTGTAIGPLAICDTLPFSTNYFLDPNISEIYWGVGRNNRLGTNGTAINLPQINFGSVNFNLPNPRTPVHEVLTRSFGRLGTNTVSLPGGSIFFGGGCSGNYDAYMHTNFMNATSILVNIVFVPTNSLLESSNLFVDVRFAPDSGSSGDLVYDPVIEFRSVDFDIVRQRDLTNYVTLIDAAATATTNIPLARPFVTTTVGSGGSRNTRRPANYNFIRGRYCSFDFAAAPNGTYDPTIFYGPNFQTNVANTFYAAYSAQVGITNTAQFTTPTLIGGPRFTTLGQNTAVSDPTGFVGRVEINARNLNLNVTRIRAENFIGIKADNVVDNILAEFDAPFINLDLASTNNPLVISNLAPASVNRLTGTVSAWSSVWDVNVTNSFGGLTRMRFHVLLVDNCLRSEQPVTIHRFAARTPTLVIQDSLFVNASVKIIAPTVCVESNGVLALPAGSGLAFSNFQSVLNFTNYGTINVPAGAYFGTFDVGHIGPQNPRRRRRLRLPPIPAPLDNFVNHGAINAAALFVRATNAEISGRPNFPAIFNGNNGVTSVSAVQVAVSNALMVSGSDVQFTADDLQLTTTFISAGLITTNNGAVRGALLLNATNSLGTFDAAATNFWRVTSGVRIGTVPLILGDFIGTHIYASAAPFWESQFSWAGEDRGPFVEGYVNNLAVGRLTLDGALGNRFHFSASPGGAEETSRAIYVDYLELLNSATNFNFALGVDPDFTIYFADSNISPEKLDDTGGGRIRWVSQFTGPQSSTNIVYPNGMTYTFNAGVVRSRDRDDDGDGVVNGEDCTPLPVPDFDSTQPCPPAPDRAKSVALSTQNIALTIALAPGAQGVVLNWNALAHSANTVEFTDSLAGPGGGTWQVLTNFINGPENARVTVKDAVAAPLRVYRVRVDAGKP